MKIAYKGQFLREGLLENGHELYDLDLKDGKNLESALKSLPAPADLVVWEFYGGISDLPSFSRCLPPVAAYCIDAPLNEFWLAPCMKNIEHVFVDQPQCVPALAKKGINASWLPLPARKSWFQPRRDKIHDITFIGRITDFRQKRKNLLKLIQSRFRLNVQTGLDIPTTQKIFSESRIIINENFFPGLTMRVLQGLSAGSVVFTEQSPYDHDFGLEDKLDLIQYNPANLIDRLGETLDNYDQYAQIGAQGQKTCARLFSSRVIAARMLEKISKGAPARTPLSNEDWQWNNIVARLLYAQRFGGNFTGPVRMLKSIAGSPSQKASAACLLLGDMDARFKSGQTARKHYIKALKIAPDSPAALKLALLDMRDRPAAAMKHIESWLQNSQNASSLKLNGFAAQSVPAAIAEIYFAMGRKWDMGFYKDFRNPVPDTAFEVAHMAWQMTPSTWALEMMIKCLRPWHTQGEVLPFMLSAIKNGLLTKRQILETARIAFDYYDPETAAALFESVKAAP